MWRQAATYRAGPSFAPPFHFPFQLNQFPFGSVPHSIKIGDVKFFASRAQARRSTSKSPAMIFWSEKIFSGCPWSTLDRSIKRTYGIFFSSRIQLQVAAGNLRDSNQLSEK